MSAIRWLSDISGDFDNAANWKGGVVPGASDGAILKAVGSPFTVTSNVDETVKSVELSGNATLDIIGGTFVAVTGTGRGANAGTIFVEAGASLAIGGTLKNRGGITLQGAGSFDASLLLTSNTTLSGSGKVYLGDGEAGGNPQVVSAYNGAGAIVLTNANNTIVGTGLVGSHNTSLQSIAFVNQEAGLIEGGYGFDGFEFGVVAPGSFISTLVNDGNIEVSKGQNIHIYNAAVSGAGDIVAGENSSMYPTYILMSGCTIVGQTLSTLKGGVLEFASSSLTIGGNINNGGALEMGSTGVLLNENATFMGGGSLEMLAATKGHPASALSGINSAIVLTNLDNTIVANGNLGRGKLTLVNDIAGTIATNGGQLTIDTGKNVISNAGLIKVVGGSGVIKSALDNDGMITADGKTFKLEGTVTGSGQATIDAGTLAFESSFNQKVAFTGTIGVLELAQSQSYTAAITGFSTKGGTSLDLRDIGFVSTNEASFSGTSASGVLTVSDGTHSAHIALDGDYLASTFTCSSDGNGGVMVTDSSGEARAIEHPASVTPQALASAIAALAPDHASTSPPTHQPWREAPPMLAAARGQLA